MEFKITKIRIPKEEIIDKKVVLLNHKANIVDPTRFIWKEEEVDFKVRDGDVGSKYPIAFIVGKKVNLKVTIRVTGDVEKSKKRQFTLKSNFQVFKNIAANNETVDLLLFKGHFDLDDTDKKKINKDGFEKELDVSVEFDPRCFFRSSRPYNWVVTANGAKTGYDVNNSTYLDLYWLYDGDFGIFRRGVPDNILEFLAAVCRAHFLSMVEDAKDDEEAKEVEDAGNDEDMKINTPKKADIVAGIVNACFYRNPPRYDIYNAAQHFTVLFRIPGNRKDESVYIYSVFMREYLEALHDPFALCNCSDMAAILKVCLTAVGIADIVLCRTDPGFLKLTNLIGRGFCNSHRYQGKKLDSIVYERSIKRQELNYHELCSWKLDTKGEGRKLDACVGPYTGDLDKSDYCREVFDSINRYDRGVPPSPMEYDPKFFVDYINGAVPLSYLKDHLPMDVSKDNIGFPEEISTVAGFVVACPWPDPTTYPVFGPGWELIFEDTVAGDDIVMKTWKLFGKGAKVQIRICVFSSKTDSEDYHPGHAMSWFLAQLSGTTSSEMPFKKGPDYLGACSAMSIHEADNYSRDFCVLTDEKASGREYSNVFIDVACTNVSFNIGTLHQWLRILVMSHRVPCLEGYVPSFENLEWTPDDRKVKVGERVTCSITRDYTAMDFKILEGDGLCLIYEGCNYKDCKKVHVLEFLALKKSTTVLRMVLYDKQTLLSNREDFIITVT